MGADRKSRLVAAGYNLLLQNWVAHFQELKVRSTTSNQAHSFYDQKYDQKVFTVVLWMVAV